MPNFLKTLFSHTSAYLASLLELVTKPFRKSDAPRSEEEGKLKVLKFNKNCVVYRKGGVVIKRFTTPEVQSDFWHECSMNKELEQLESEHLLLVSLVHETKFYLQIPYCPWPALDEIDFTALTERMRDRIWESLLSVVFSMHEIGLFHNDLHPGNMLVDSNPPYLKLIDFGETNKLGLPCKFDPWIFRNPAMKTLQSSPLNDYWSMGIIFILLGELRENIIVKIIKDHPRIDHYHILTQKLIPRRDIPLAQALLKAMHGHCENLQNLFGERAREISSHKF